MTFPQLHHIQQHQNTFPFSSFLFITLLNVQVHNENDFSHSSLKALRSPAAKCISLISLSLPSVTALLTHKAHSQPAQLSLQHRLGATRAPCLATAMPRLKTGAARHLYMDDFFLCRPFLLPDARARK